MECNSRSQTNNNYTVSHPNLFSNINPETLFRGTIQTRLRQGNTGAEVEDAKVENMQESEINAVPALKAKKYGDLNDAADIY